MRVVCAQEQVQLTLSNSSHNVQTLNNFAVRRGNWGLPVGGRHLREAVLLSEAARLRLSCERRGASFAINRSFFMAGTASPGTAWRAAAAGGDPRRGRALPREAAPERATGERASVLVDAIGKYGEAWVAIRARRMCSPARRIAADVVSELQGVTPHAASRSSPNTARCISPTWSRAGPSISLGDFAPRSAQRSRRWKPARLRALRLATINAAGLRHPPGSRWRRPVRGA